MVVSTRTNENISKGFSFFFFFLFHSFFVSFLPPVLVIMRMWQAYEYRYCPPYRSLANPRRRSGPRKGNCSSEKTSALSKEHRQIGQGSLSSGSNFRVGWRPSAIIDDKRRTLSSSPLFVEEDRPVFVSLYRRIEFYGTGQSIESWKTDFSKRFLFFGYNCVFIRPIEC